MEELMCLRGSFLWLICKQEIRYIGQWSRTHMHGAGEMSWGDGRKYIGGYSEDRKHGEGIFTWADGREYNGQWHEGAQHGLGRYKNPQSVLSLKLNWTLMEQPLAHFRPQGKVVLTLVKM
eukprot:5790081-Amphidinium_carterae.1